MEDEHKPRQIERVKSVTHQFYERVQTCITFVQNIEQQMESILLLIWH